MSGTMRYNEKKITERQLSELIGLCRGIIADGQVNQAEADFVYKWLVANEKLATSNPIAATLLLRINDMLQDGLLEEDESAELLETLTHFVGESGELGDDTESTVMPLCDPPPKVLLDMNIFCFSGTFEYGSRADCEDALRAVSAIRAKDINTKVDYLVVGKYTNQEWSNSVYGRKIEKAMEYREKYGIPKIISEEHWLKAMQSYEI